MQKKQETLKLELKITKTYKKSSDLTASLDLLKKITQSIQDNKKRADYLAEDYFQYKNQVDQINKTIINYDLEINQLNAQKKICFSQINKITRQSEDSTKLNENEALKKLGINIGIPNSEKIRMLQLKARDISFNIKQIKSQQEQSRLKLENIKPKYLIYKKDYEKLLSIIERDQKKVKELEVELQRVIEEKDELHQEKLEAIKIIRPISQIEEELEIVTKELNEITKSKKLINFGNIQELSQIEKKIDVIDQKINHLKTNMDKEKFIESFKNFQKIELILDDLEKNLILLMREINLSVQFQISINKSNTKFFVNSLFERNNKEKINFNELTTPEKVYFIFALYITLNIILNEKNIVFSNLFIPNEYNKSGSIIRTIRKILPLFKVKENLKGFKLIFLMSNIDIKKEIKNLKTIEFQEG